jgi:ketosteroid isomerase-like protein
MPKAKLQVPHVGGSASDVEAAFYDALQSADIEKLMACWADEDEVVCVHPGGARLLGLGAIRDAFETLFSNGSVRAFPERVRCVDAMASAVHSLVERIEIMTPQGPQEAYVLATNVYHKTAQGWRLVAHHASPGTLTEVHEAQDAPQVLH